MYFRLTGYPRTCDANKKTSEPTVNFTCQTLATPTIALLKSASVLMPSVSYNIAYFSSQFINSVGNLDEMYTWEAPWSFGWVMILL